MLENWLFVEWYRVMHSGWDAGIFEVLLHVFPVVREDRVLRVDAGPVGFLRHARNARLVH